MVADIEPIIVEEPAPAAPKEWVPRETEESSGISDYPLLNCTEFAEEEPEQKDNPMVIIGIVVAALAACSVTVAVIVRKKNNRRTD